MVMRRIVAHPRAVVAVLLWKTMPPSLARGAASSRLLAHSRVWWPSSFAAFPVLRRCHPRRRWRGRTSGLRASHGTTSATSEGGVGRGADGGAYRRPPEVVPVPLVFVPGMKGTHLAFADGGDGAPGEARKKRAWLTLGNLLNFPPRPDDDPSRDLSLPLTYDIDRPTPEMGEDGREYDASRYPRQHWGKLAPDGTVDHIIEFGVGSGDGTANFADMNFLPFYGHAVSSSARDRSQSLRLILAMLTTFADPVRILSVPD